VTTAFQQSSFQDNAFQIDGAAAVVRVESGAARYYPKKRKKPIDVIRWSDFETREKRAEALAQALATAAIPIKTFVEEEDMEELDDEIVIKALTAILH
jgi:hypothetical protein